MKMHQNLVPLLFLALSLTWISCDNSARKNADLESLDEVEEKVSDKVLAQEVYKNQLDENKTPAVYFLEEVDKMPLFDPSCLTSEDPENCSDEKLFSFLDQHIKFEQAEGISRYVEFTISAFGEVNNIQYISNATEICEDCKASAIAAIEKMQKWEPAVKNGEPVATTMRIEL